MNHSDDDRELHFRIKGKPEFTDDYSHIQALAPGGSVTIEEKTLSLARKLEITRADDGQLQRKYSVDGAERELDAKGKRSVTAPRVSSPPAHASSSAAPGLSTSAATYFQQRSSSSEGRPARTWGG